MSETANGECMNCAARRAVTRGPWRWFQRTCGRALGLAAVKSAARFAGAVGGGTMSCLALALLSRVDGDRERAAVIVREVTP